MKKAMFLTAIFVLATINLVGPSPAIAQTANPQTNTITDMPPAANTYYQEALRLRTEAENTYPAGSGSIDKPLWNQAIAATERALVIAPKNTTLLRLRAEMYTSIKFWTRAEEAWQNYFAIASDAASEDREAYANLQLQLGFAAYERQEPREALKRFGLATQFDPQLARAYEWQGRIHMEQGDATTALPFWERAAKLDPQPSTLYFLNLARQAATYGPEAMHAFLSGYDAYNNGDTNTALEQFRAAAIGAPRFVEAQRWLGRVALELGSATEAAQAFEAVIKIEGENAQNKYFLDYAHEVERYGVEAVFFYRQGYDKYNKGDKAGAQDAFKKAVAANAQHQKAWAWLGRTRFETGDFKGAAEAYEKAVALDPNDKSSAYQLKLAKQKISK